MNIYEKEILRTLIKEIKSIKSHSINGKVSLHKPIFLLYLLSKISKGKFLDNKVMFSEVEVELANLIKDLGDVSGDPHPEYPFFHLSNSTFWNLSINNNGFSISPTKQYLRQNNVFGFFNKDIHELITKYSEVRAELIDVIVNKWWFARDHNKVREVFSLSSANDEINQYRNDGINCDGNIAINCAWNDCGYTGVCYDQAYKNNIKTILFCASSNCRQYVDFNQELLGENDYPCFESELFVKFAMGKVNSKGEPVQFRGVKPGKIALLTTVKPGKTERERFIFGFLYIQKVSGCFKSEGNTYIVGNKKLSRKLDPTITEKFLFWDYFNSSNKYNENQWNEEVLLYPSDSSILDFLNNLKVQTSDCDRRYLESLISQFKSESLPIEEEIQQSKYVTSFNSLPNAIPESGNKYILKEVMGEKYLILFKSNSKIILMDKKYNTKNLSLNDFSALFNKSIIEN